MCKLQKKWIYQLVQEYKIGACAQDTLDFYKVYGIIYINFETSE